MIPNNMVSSTYNYHKQQYPHKPNIAGLLQILMEKNLIAETGSSSRAIELDHIQEEIKEVTAVPEVKEKKKSRNALRKGSGGEEVRAMQEALQKLGFYSGEEDMESSSFSSEQSLHFLQPDCKEL
ncbi:PREDICTED: uncharacterized protein LOC103335433 [Prunus mume]|uniref:Uncharacterized protein LOC103335433 n=1 Tax=Prunus mume TaxID=102107 RepID=A0ABM0PAC6_PRUMU|nr:PREDICTED: uncharacterized protein LOC103335433 [Prunus mume]